MDMNIQSMIGYGRKIVNLISTENVSALTLTEIFPMNGAKMGQI
jgi:hypothetical protein